ncbi:FAD-dependent oxidoreductase, partial [Streptomyces sp. 3N207]
FPTTARALEQRNDMLRKLSTMPPATEGRPAHSALTLPEFMPTA